jgi:hypothetical protein
MDETQLLTYYGYNVSIIKLKGITIYAIRRVGISQLTK